MKTGTNKVEGLNLANASKTTKRRELDFYPTPPEATHALMNFLNLNKKHNVWEPACGEGHMSRVISEYVGAVLSTDIRQTSFTKSKPLDFLKGESLYPVGFMDAIITNPPFKDSAEFIKIARSHKPKIVAMLLKSQYWHVAKRAALFEEMPPAYVLPLTWRVDFSGGGRPTMEVVWNVWIEGDTNTKYRPLGRVRLGKLEKDKVK